MVRPQRRVRWASTLLISLLLAACGGGGGDDNGSISNPVTTVSPQAATDSINQFNVRRQQIGLPTLARNGMIDTAAQGHSHYQTYNGITHEQIPGRQGFTGEKVLDRLEAAGYRFARTGVGVAGEVIVRTRNPSGTTAAEDLIAAIYHRFVIFEPVFKEIGSGASTAGDGNIYITTNFAVNGMTPVLGSGNVATYPYANQQSVQRNFFSDNEVPDPVPSRNEVGYPISVHADANKEVNVQTFTVRPRGGSALPAYLLERTTDQHMLATGLTSVAAIVPENPLAAGTTYDVQFIGTVGGTSVNRSWSFTTQ